MRHLLTICWISVISALLFMVLGHLGQHDLSWKVSQISTYAATAPYDYFITTSMLLSSAALIATGILISKHNIFRFGYLAHFAPVLSGASASGLLMLAYFEETAKNLPMLKKSGFWAIRVQSFHDAGLLIFFYGAILLVILLGILTAIYNFKKSHKLFGILIISFGPAAYFLMTTPWPKYVGFEGITTGINQRAALFCLWAAVTIFLAVISNNAPLQASIESSDRISP